MTADRGPLAEGVLIAMLTLGGVFVFARVITRSIIRPQLFSWDDGLIVVTWVRLFKLHLCCRAISSLLFSLSASIG